MAKVGSKKGLQCIGITVPEIARIAKQRLPGLKTGCFSVTSCPDSDYNCIAWAAGDDKNFWWPIDGHWPDDVPRERTMEAFVKLFENRGYVECDDVTYENGYEKVAIYAKNGLPTHAARQIGPQKWSSKLGPFADITHRLVAVEGEEYGRKVAVMKRRRQN